MRDTLIPRALRQLMEVRPGLLESGKRVFPQLMVQVWNEVLRNRELADLVQTGYDRVRAAWARVVESCRSAGLISVDADADATARVMIALAQGHAVRLAVIGDPPAGTLEAGLRTLMSMRDPRPAG